MNTNRAMTIAAQTVAGGGAGLIFTVIGFYFEARATPQPGEPCSVVWLIRTFPELIVWYVLGALAGVHCAAKWLSREWSVQCLFIGCYAGAVLAIPVFLRMGLGLADIALLPLYVFTVPTALALALDLSGGHASHSEALLQTTPKTGLTKTEKPKQPFDRIHISPVLAIPFAALIASFLVWMVGFLVIPNEEWCGYYPLGNPLFFVLLVGSILGYELGATLALVDCLRVGRSRRKADSSGWLDSFGAPVLMFLIVTAMVGPAAMLILKILAYLGLGGCR